MGYGIKTDPSTGRELNLDKTYKNIIKPAAEEAGLECVRADEVKHSGIIDVPMYNLLVSADVVIADLSIQNTNAFYELGVRHALRPKTTIAIAESKLKPPFDVNHTVIHQYEHLGTDIGFDEVLRFRGELIETINAILASEEIDSPVYTYIKELKPPVLDTSIEEKDGSSVEEEPKETLGGIIENAILALDNDDFVKAKTLLQAAKSIDPNNDFILQKLAVATYKSKYPNHVEALREALTFIEPLDLRNTTDPETLGIAGAIYKRLWEEQDDLEYLDKSIFYYEKGFYIKNDYYNGVNLAFLYNIRSTIEQDKNNAIADFIIANRIRNKIIKICSALYNDDSFKDRSDQYWIVATLEEAYFGLGNKDKYDEFKEVAMSLSKQNWERETTESQIIKIRRLLENSVI
ncbi:TRAFs-binding domain-containing protein [Rossellomorea aquimaris]|uniref:TRAFs-binding domain-containing protein n=1 Tax=Rossellomorea aquimaris TaxID=189382 RepID=UPI0007D06924|nr:TRAFs-binding domain-containing protein [Rossellomorea aquimaris]